MTFHILTIFPHIFDSYINETILKRAREAGIIDIIIHDIRAFATDKHKTTDDTPTGGGPGMVMRIEPIYTCLLDIRTQQDKNFDIQNNAKNFPHNVFYRNDSPIILTSARGTQFTQSDALSFTKNKKQKTEYCSLVLICGRYEGVDQRVADHMIDNEYSIGPYVLSGGELPALVITEAITRLIPGVLGNEESLHEESYTDKKKEYPQYTKPATFSPIPDTEWHTPDILLSGNHAKIKKWREDRSSS